MRTLSDALQRLRPAVSTCQSDRLLGLQAKQYMGAGSTGCGSLNAGGCASLFDLDQDGSVRIQCAAIKEKDTCEPQSPTESPAYAVLPFLC